jgi:hypothetical protein
MKVSELRKMFEGSVKGLEDTDQLMVAYWVQSRENTEDHWDRCLTIEDWEASIEDFDNLFERADLIWGAFRDIAYEATSEHGHPRDECPYDENGEVKS